jgi:hypothetical protein
MLYSSSSFRCEAPERSFLLSALLGASPETTLVTAGIGGFKSTVAQLLVCTIGGAPTNKQSIGYRGLFSSLVWLGEGATAVYEYGDKQKSLLLYPYGDDGDNHMEYGGEESPIAVSYLTNMGDVLLSKNVSLSKQRIAEIDSVFHESIGLVSTHKYSTKELREQLNVVVPSAMTHATYMLALAQSIMTSDIVVGDYVSPGLDRVHFNRTMKFAQELALVQKTKLIFFFPRHYMDWLDICSPRIVPLD